MSQLGSVAWFDLNQEKIKLWIPPSIGPAVFLRSNTELALALPRYDGIDRVSLDFGKLRAQQRGGIRLTSPKFNATFWTLDRPKAIRALGEFGWDVRDMSESVWRR